MYGDCSCVGTDKFFLGTIQFFWPVTEIEWDIQMQSLSRGRKVFQSVVRNQLFCTYTYQHITVNEFKKIMNGRERKKYCVADIREIDDDESLSLPKEYVDKEWPVMYPEGWRDEMESMDRMKPIVLVVSCLNKYCCCLEIITLHSIGSDGYA